MLERSAEEIAAAQLNHDVTEAKRALLELVNETLDLPDGVVSGAAADQVDAIENLIGKTVMRWWFARIVKNKAAHLQINNDELEARRRVRATKLIACCTTINGKATAGNPPDNLQLQMAIMDLTAAQSAIWQALIDAAIISPDGKQQYLDTACDELYARVVGYASRLDLTTQGPLRPQ